jgi:hypothetical protein
MTTPRVFAKNEVSLNDVFFKLRGPVRAVVVPPYITGQDIGDTGGAAPGARVQSVRWDNAQRGIGKKDHVTDDDVFRMFYSTSHLRQDGHLTLPDRVTTTADSGVAGVIKVGTINELANKVYASFSTSIRSYTFNTDSWGSNLQTMDTDATDSISERFGGTVYLIFTTGNNYYHTTDGSAWTTVTDNVKFLAGWDDRLWGIDSTGQLRWAFDPTGSWTDDAQLPLPDDSVQDLLVGPDASGEQIIYADTKEGLFAHDIGNNRFIKTGAAFPFHDDAGAGAVVWQSRIYTPAGLGIYQYEVGGDRAVVRPVGPDRDSGLPSDKRGKIVRLEATHNDLVALVDSTSAATETLKTFASGGLRSRARAFSKATGTSLILGWNGLGWQVLHETSVSTEAITAARVTSAYGDYRLWFGHERLVKFFTLPVDIVNPSEISDRVYADASLDTRPWFSGGRTDRDKIAVRLHVEVADASTTETVIPSIFLNYDDDTVASTLSTITSDGTHTYHLPDLTAGSAALTSVGLAFRAIRVDTAMANGTNNSLSPDIRSVTLEWREKLPAPQRRIWDLDIDLTKSWAGNTPKQLRAALETVGEKNLLSEFTYRDDDGNTRNYAVEVATRADEEQTGHDERGIARLRVVQV